MSLRRSVLAATMAGALSVTVLAGCKSSSSDSGSPAPAPSSAVTTPTNLRGSASSALSKAHSAAGSALSEVSDGVIANDDASTGAVTVDGEGHATTRLTVKNPTGAEHDYTVSVIFDSSDSRVPDVVVVSVAKVPAHGESQATARSARKLTGTVTAKVSAAVQH